MTIVNSSRSFSVNLQHVLRFARNNQRESLVWCGCETAQTAVAFYHSSAPETIRRALICSRLSLVAIIKPHCYLSYFVI